MGPLSLQTPHTGALDYATDVPRIPAASLTVEGAALLERLTRAGNRVVVNLSMEAEEKAHRLLQARERKTTVPDASRRCKQWP